MQGYDVAVDLCVCKIIYNQEYCRMNAVQILRKYVQTHYQACMRLCQMCMRQENFIF